MAGLMLAAALAAQGVAPAAPPAALPVPAQVRLYREVALSPSGDRIATVETDELAASETDPHETVVVRSRASGEVLDRYDPCSTCDYTGPAWSPDGQVLAFAASDRKARAAAVIVVRDGKAAAALNFAGLIAQ